MNNKKWIIPSILLINWFIISSSNIINPYILPHPLTVIYKLLDYIFNLTNSYYSGTMLSHAFFSMKRILIGFSIAAFSGIFLAMYSGINKQFHQVIDTTIQLIKTIPGVSWLPIAIIWFGIGEKTTIFLIALAAFFPIYTTIYTSITTIPTSLLNLSLLFEATKKQQITTIIIPYCWPHIISGFRQGLAISWAYLVLGELSGVNKGLGSVLTDARISGQIDMVIVSMITIACFGSICDYILKTIGKDIYVNTTTTNKEI